METTVVTFGTFDVFHVGHVNILTRAHDLGSRLLVGVSTDALTVAKKGRTPFYSEAHRLHIVASLACVSGVFLEHSLELKREYLVEHRADVLVMGDDWAGKFDDLKDIVDVVYLPRTEDISTTDIIQLIRDSVV